MLTVEDTSLRPLSAYGPVLAPLVYMLNLPDRGRRVNCFV